MTHTNKPYYLLNDHHHGIVRYYHGYQLCVKETPDFCDADLNNLPDSKKLTDRQHALLMYFLGKPNEDISRFEIQDSLKLSRPTFYTHLGVVRKTLQQLVLAEDEKTFIKNEHGSGCYEFRASCRLVEFEKPINGYLVNSTGRYSRHPIKGYSSAVSSSTRTILSLLVFSIATIAFVLQLVHPLDKPSHYELSDVRQVTSMPGIVSQPYISNDGKYIAFAHRQDTKIQNIYAKQISGRDNTILTSGHYDNSPVFSPSGLSLIYQRINDKHCEVRLIQFSSGLKISSDKKIYTCSKYSYVMSFGWISDSEVLLNESREPFGPFELVLLDTDSEVSQDYLNPELALGRESATGFIKFAVDINSDSTYILESQNWRDTKIHSYQDGKLTEKLHVSASLSGVAIFDSDFVYKDVDNRLKLGSTKSPIMTSWPKQISYPTASLGNDTKMLAFTSGTHAANKIVSLNLEDGTETQILLENFSNRMPLLANNE